MSLARRTLAAAAALAALAAPARAQQAERGAFVLKVGADTFAVERFTRSQASLEGEITLPGRARVPWSAQYGADRAVSRFEVRVFALSAPRDAPPAQTVTVEFRGDSAHTSAQGAGGPAQTLAFAAPKGTVPFTNPSVLLMEEILVAARRLGGRDSASVPVLAVGSAPSTVMVRWIGADSATLAIGTATVRARVNAAGRLLGAAVPAQSLAIERTGELPAGAGTSVPGPSYAAPAGAPYTAEEVKVTAPGGFTLAGTLTKPRNASGRLPAVITISGSGQQDRDESLVTVPGYRPFRQVADTLSRRGIAVLRLDDRGVGGSGGAVDSATSVDFAGDVRAAVAYLRARPDIDPKRIALLGHSEGGVIAPMVAADDPELRAIVLIAGTARAGRSVLDDQLRYGAQNDTTLRPAQRDSALRGAQAQIDSMIAQVPWFRWFATYDPLPTARRVKQPVLILQGATDRQVTAEQAEQLGAAIREAGNRDVTVRVFPGVNHLLLRDPSGHPGRYASLPSKSVEREVLGTLADWLAEKLK